MTVRVGINGFGRIGRQSLKAIIERTPDVEVVAVNDLVDVKLNALLFKHDSTYGAYPGTVESTDDDGARPASGFRNFRQRRRRMVEGDVLANGPAEQKHFLEHHAKP